MHSTFLKSLKLLTKAKERRNVSSGKAGFEWQMVTASRGRGGSWNGPQRTDFKGQPVEGQRGRPMRRSQPSRPLKTNVVVNVECWDISCTTILSCKYKENSQILQEVTNHLMTNRGKVHQMKEEFSERGYEKDEYEVEVQAFMARGQGERQERAEAREARRRREEGAAPAEPSAPVRPIVERAAQPKQARRKLVLEAQWQKYMRESWTIPIGMLAGKSRREVCAQSVCSPLNQISQDIFG